MADNFWSMGVPGPCGPCSEIYYDRGPDYGIEGGPIADEDRYLEVWNLVFMQYVRGRRHRQGGLRRSSASCRSKNIDTGMGVERMAFLLQGVDNVYETDLLRPIIDRAESCPARPTAPTTTPTSGCGSSPTTVRSALMLIADGVTPGNEGRGYVLRRLLRRTVRSRPAARRHRTR